MIVGTKAEFQQLADYVLHDYLGEHYHDRKAIDIMDFAVNYLKMQVSYEEMPEEYIGLCYDDKIVISKALYGNKRLTGVHNFTLAHECAHELINCQESYQNRKHEKKYRIVRKNSRLQTEEDFSEWQANVVAAYLLMPTELIGWTVYTFVHEECIYRYGHWDYFRKDKQKIKDMSCFLGVSVQALMIRLEELNYIREKPLSEVDLYDLYFF